MFQAIVSKNQISVVQTEPITSGSVNAYLVKFEFSEEWDDLTRVAVFKTTGDPIDVLLDDTNTCFIPWEVMTEFGKAISFGVYGTRGDEIVLPTIWVKTAVILEGVITGIESNPPSPSLLAQLMDKLKSLEDEINSITAGGSVVESGSGVPKGTIVIWSGSVDAIPFGWVLCNGENGTPDLRDRFVLGAGDAHSVGEEGGEEEHVLTSSEMPNHSHAQRYRASGTTTIGDFTFANRTASSTSYTATAVSTATAGSGQAHNNMPPYYALCYIMCVVDSGESSNPGGSTDTESPIGTIQAMMSTTPPDGYLVCDGATYSISEYPMLAAHFKKEFGATNYFGGDGASTFAVPDLRDQFLRGYHGDGATQYSGAIGAKQAGTLLPNYWSYFDGANPRIVMVGDTGNALTNIDRDTSSGNLSTYRVNASATTSNSGATATEPIKVGIRPSNVAVLYCIRCTTGSTQLDANLRIEDYNTDDGWHVRKWSNGYLEMDYQGTSVLPKGYDWVQFGTAYRTADDFFPSVKFPFPLVEKYTESLSIVDVQPSNVTLTPYVIRNSNNYLEYSNRHGASRPNTVTVGVDTVYTYGIHVTGLWKEYSNSNESNIETTYSTEEHAIGTWIDGRTVYRRVFQAMTPSSAGVNAIIKDWTEDVDIVSMSGVFIKNDGSVFSINKPGTSGNANIVCAWYVSGKGIGMNIGDADYADRPATIIVEYARR